MTETQPLRDELILMNEEMEELKSNIAYVKYKCEQATDPIDRARYELQLEQSNEVVKDLEETANNIMKKLDLIDKDGTDNNDLEKTTPYITEPKSQEYEEDPELAQMKAEEEEILRQMEKMELEKANLEAKLERQDLEEGVDNKNTVQLKKDNESDLDKIKKERELERDLMLQKMSEKYANSNDKDNIMDVMIGEQLKMIKDLQDLKKIEEKRSNMEKHIHEQNQQLQAMREQESSLSKFIVRKDNNDDLMEYLYKEESRQTHLVQEKEEAEKKVEIEKLMQEQTDLIEQLKEAQRLKDSQK